MQRSTYAHAHFLHACIRMHIHTHTHTQKKNAPLCRGPRPTECVICSQECFIDPFRPQLGVVDWATDTSGLLRSVRKGDTLHVGYRQPPHETREIYYLEVRARVCVRVCASARVCVFGLVGFVCFWL